MSVILTACRHSRQKAMARALKKKADKQRAKREEATKSAAAHKDAMDEIEGENNVKIWTFMLNGDPTSVVLHRDTLEVACDGEVVESTTDFCECGSTISFLIKDQSAQIVCSFGETPRDESTFALSIEGYPVPDVVMDDVAVSFDEDSGPSATHSF